MNEISLTYTNIIYFIVQLLLYIKNSNKFIYQNKNFLSYKITNCTTNIRTHAYRNIKVSRLFFPRQNILKTIRINSYEVFGRFSPQNFFCIFIQFYKFVRTYHIHRIFCKEFQTVFQQHLKLKKEKSII